MHPPLDRLYNVGGKSGDARWAAVAVRSRHYRINRASRDDFDDRGQNCAEWLSAARRAAGYPTYVSKCPKMSHNVPLQKKLHPCRLVPRAPTRRIPTNPDGTRRNPTVSENVAPNGTQRPTLRNATECYSLRKNGRGGRLVRREAVSCQRSDLLGRDLMADR